MSATATDSTGAAGTQVAAPTLAELSRARVQAQLWYWQRISAMVLAVCVVIHLVGIVYAVRGGLSAAEILGRTRGNWAFGAFYGVFVIACAIHAPIGLANVIHEWRGERDNLHIFVAQVFAVLIAVLGFVAVYAVVA